MAIVPINIAPAYIMPEVLFSAVAAWALLSLEILIFFLEAGVMGWLYKKDFASSMKLSAVNNVLSFLVGTPMMLAVSILLRPGYYILRTSVYPRYPRYDQYWSLIGVVLFVYAFISTILIEAYATYRQLKKETSFMRCVANSTAVNSLSYPLVVLPLLLLFTFIGY